MTENHNFNTPSKGATDWHIPVNQNFTKLDATVEVRDAESALSDYAPKPGAKFLATDTENVYLGNGSSWSKLASSGKNASFSSVKTDELYVGGQQITGSSSGGGQATFDVVVSSGDDLAGAIANAGENARVYVKAGEYSLSQHQLSVPSGQHIVGHPGAVVTPTSGGEAMFTPQSHVHIEGLTFDAKGTEHEGIDIRGDHVTIENCEFRNHSRGKYPCNVYRADNFAYVNNYSHDNGEYGLAVSGEIGQGDWCTHGIIAGNRIESCGGVGIKLRGAKHCTISDNTVKMPGNSYNDSTMGIRLYSADEPNRFNTIVGNTVTLPEVGSGSYFPFYAGEDTRSSSTVSKGNIVVGNTFTGGRYTAYSVQPNVTFMNNQFHRSSGKALSINTGGDRNVAKGNVVTSGDLEINANECVVTGNVLQNGQIYDNGSSTSLSGNH